MEISTKSISAGKYIDLLNSRLPIGQKTIIGDKEYKNDSLRYELSLPLISKLDMLDLGETEDLFLYAPNITTNTEYGLNYIK